MGRGGLPEPSPADLGCWNERTRGRGFWAGPVDEYGRKPGPALVGPRRGRAGPADGGAGRHNREYRAALGPARSGLLQRRPAVGGDGVLTGLRRPAAAWRTAV